LYFVQFIWVFNRPYYRIKKVVGVFVRFSCAASSLTVSLPGQMQAGCLLTIYD
jgi:hypothetical protein